MALLLGFQLLGLVCARAAVGDASLPRKELPLPGDLFVVEGRPGFLIPAPVNTAREGKPWVWYAPTLPGLPGKEEQWMFERFLEAGIGIAGIDVGESFGSPDGRRLFDAFHAEMTGKKGYSAKPVLLGRSRGGLMTLAWGVENPEKVGGFAGIYPVCNVASYPGIARAAGAYGMTAAALEACLKDHNPVDRLGSLARAGVPLFAIHGDVDATVPLEANSGLVKQRYTALGGAMELIVPPGQGHNMWPGFFQCQELVRFTRTHAGPNLTLHSPRDYQVLQRSSKSRGTLMIRGEWAGISAGTPTIEARLEVDGRRRRWRRLAVHSESRRFEAAWEVPAGGWHRLRIRASFRGKILAESTVEHVGVGEVFVVAGQSNSANHGEERQKTQTGLVTAFDGTRWALADDPQPGASGGGGSFIPPFGDAMAIRFRVPIGIVACGVGATSVREWLPAGARFPNPPTLVGNVQQVSENEWESRGTLYSAFVARMKPFGPRGFRAVLWHQGESDANQADPGRTLLGSRYRDYLAQLILGSRRELGWEVPWCVALASYHGPADEGSPDLRQAQAALWENGMALEGPDSDALKGSFRDNGGRGVHFSGPGLREHGTRWADKVTPWLERRLR